MSKLHLLIGTFLFATLLGAAAVPIFDSMAEFSGVQGQDGWNYGYYDGDSASPFTSSDFEEMPQFIDGNRWIIHWGDPSGYWTTLTAAGGHPNGPVGNYYQATEHWAVRRWTSNIDGTIRIDGVLAKSQTGGDGITGNIFVNDTEIYGQYISRNDTVGTTYSVQTEISVCDTIDFAIVPGAADQFDSTRFTAVGTVIPEPMTAAFTFISLGVLYIRRKMFFD